MGFLSQLSSWHRIFRTLLNLDNCIKQTRKRNITKYQLLIWKHLIIPLAKLQIYIFDLDITFRHCKKNQGCISVLDFGLYSMKRRRPTDIGIPIINLIRRAEVCWPRALGRSLKNHWNSMGHGTVSHGTPESPLGELTSGCGLCTRARPEVEVLKLDWVVTAPSRDCSIETPAARMRFRSSAIRWLLAPP